LRFLFCFSMHISKRALRNQFDPRVYVPQDTYLLCKLQWGKNGIPWIHWVRNDRYSGCHAEEYFLEEIFELRSSNSCDITWYLSWSPCPMCCSKIRVFLERHPKVTINICIARVYYANNENHRRALKDLYNLPRVNHLASLSPDYVDCWNTFIQKGVHCDFSPENFGSAIQRNRMILKRILEVSTL
ncbi:ABEC1 enzyme, partial [Edolisoma coerulescens]|nr:ABEC1 enzyme [Edolisoma coerulescens]